MSFSISHRNPHEIVHYTFFSLSYRACRALSDLSEVLMPLFDSQMLLALAALVSSISTLIWSVRRRS